MNRPWVCDREIVRFALLGKIVRAGNAALLSGSEKVDKVIEKAVRCQPFEETSRVCRFLIFLAIGYEVMDIYCKPLILPEKTFWWRLSINWKAPWEDTFFHDVCQQLICRQEIQEECEALWDAYPEINRKLRQEVSQIIKEYMFWPNSIFIPEDPLSILFLESSPDMRNVEALLKLEPLFEKPIQIDFAGCLLDLFNLG